MSAPIRFGPTRKMSVEQIDAAKARYLSGESCDHIAADYRLAGTSVWGALKRRGIVMRAASETAKIAMIGRRFGRLTVLSEDGAARNRQARWRCRCDCGNVKTVDGSSLRRGDVVSCRCFRQERRTRHGMSYTNEYRMWESAKARARRDGLAFNLEVSDITIPSHCPVLGIPVVAAKGRHGPTQASPTLDRLIPSRGYVKGNVAVISFRANTIKSNATAEELRRVHDYVVALGTNLECGREAASGIAL